MSSSHSERTDLPDRVAPGRESRDIAVDHRLVTRPTRGTEGDR
ncbi:hypothetical protein ACF09H_35120 [Streptomyces sp. NPDC014983]